MSEKKRSSFLYGPKGVSELVTDSLLTLDQHLVENKRTALENALDSLEQVVYLRFGNTFETCKKFQELARQVAYVYDIKLVF